jgi:K+-transporting ATPase KdpF subunit
MIAATSYDNWIGLALAIAAIGYLIAVLVFPERF